MEARALGELGLLEVARLYGLHQSAPAPVRAPGLAALATRDGEWLVVGEEATGEADAFAGAAGKLLDAMLASVGCRREGEATPLEAQLDRRAPKVLLALGEGAASLLLGAGAPLDALRGRVHRFGERPVVVTHRPSDLLAAPADKARAWEDLLLARRTAAGG